MSDVRDTLKERGTRYGDFETHAQISQRLKEVIREFDGNLDYHHKEALDMIVHKIARILNGDPNFADSWHDQSGYATLVEDIITRKVKPL